MTETSPLHPPTSKNTKKPNPKPNTKTGRAGKDRFLADTLDGATLRHAGEHIINIVTVSESLPEAFKRQSPEIAWRENVGMRNRIAMNMTR